MIEKEKIVRKNTAYLNILILNLHIVYKYPNKNNNISCVVSSKNNGPTYQNRINFITKYSNDYQNSIDIFGKGWKMLENVGKCWSGGMRDGCVIRFAESD